MLCVTGRRKLRLPGVTLRTSLFDGEYEALAAWTGQTTDEDDSEALRDLWLAWDGPQVVGTMTPWLRPDGRRTLYFGPCAPSAYPALVARVPGECYTMVDGSDTAAMDQLAALGFLPERSELRYSIPVSLLDAPAPTGLDIISAARTDLEPLMALDCALREDVPGSDGWQPDPVWFRQETYDSPAFDPETYLVALDGEEYVGLVRIWIGPRPLPRLGLIAVLPAYRRRGLATALIGQAFAALHARGEKRVTAEVDAGNTPSNTLMTGLGGTVTGSDVELRRAAGE
jgi:ribosomal protein S18 acetylase RimI-like enzyme